MPTLEQKSKKYWRVVSLRKEDIDRIFTRSKHQSDYIVKLYDHALTMSWRSIKQIFGYPEVSEKTAKYIFEKARAFDRFYGIPNPGNAWQIWGFESSKDLQDWKVDCQKLTFEFTENKNKNHKKRETKNE